VSESSPDDPGPEEQDHPSAATVGDEVTDIVQPENASTHPKAGTMRAGEAGSVDSSNTEKWHIEEGEDVIGTCGHKVGEVMDVEGDYIVVEKGFFITEDLYVPKEAIAGHDKHGVHLNVTKHDVDEAGWNHEPGESTPKPPASTKSTP
jgi:hypothetical protein